MKLYGLALAAVAHAENRGILDISCTPVSITDGNRQSLAPEPRVFDKTIDIADLPRFIETYEEVVETLDHYLGLQRHNLAAYTTPRPYLNRKFRQLAIEIGDAETRPVHTDSLTIPLFGENFSNSDKTHLGMPTEENTDRAIKAKYKLAAKLATMTQRRVDFLSQRPDWAERLQMANARLRDILKECVLKVGNFNKRKAKSVDGKTTPTPVQLPLDRELIALREGYLANEFAACARVLLLATRQGIQDAAYVNKNYKVFQISAPAGYWENLEMQKTHPRYSYHLWGADGGKRIRQAYYNGYYAAYTGKYFRHLKLPSDKPNRPFVDPVGDMIMEQWQVLSGEREWPVVVDDPYLRSRIMDLAHKTANRLVFA